MLLGEPPATAWDLNFRIFGFSIRVTPWFWLAAALLGYGISGRGPDQFKILLVWVSAVFVSILIHELGHAFAFRRYGLDAHIVLYHFGGLAIPGSSWGTGRPTRGHSPAAQVIISAAGPVLQLAVAALCIALLGAARYEFHVPGFVGDFIPLPPPTRPIPSLWARLFVVFFLYASIYWALLNLLPVYPLDGGQIARELFLLFDRNDPVRHSLALSMFTAGGLAVYGLTSGDTYLGIMFGMLAFSSYQSLQGYSGRSSPW